MLPLPPASRRRYDGGVCRGATPCTGLPPLSCQAFGDGFELQLSDPTR